MQTYKDLIVWKKSIDFVLEIYKLTNSFPNEEKFGLSSQMRRAAVSIPSNIAEGYARKSTKENAQFLNIAFGSATEVETQIIIAKKLNFINIESYKIADGLLNEILKMLYKYRESLYK
ncbi:MAG: four helix bundle protein [Candidatus Magasanikbacteria bacterium RIFOXYC12_FULL_33_11]|uniref:Four helix bundle protein n=1 Tax=Candidatus Magasanikbacteria bacterium RIFOXYC12_FULL_33_11 TaxID=1798701 RepID=A0A1F6NMC6_9BACT|nr:four helix bundle protein [Patescibacteria group bacterium]OGH85092.1 MAG: four helix bundle protein [Candidatus Magasanikbacteria bacterium RIFOXYC12_FULL_33_11]